MSTQNGYSLPLLTKCFVCVPLRLGLILFGYANFIYSMSMAVYVAQEVWEDHPSSGTLVFRGLLLRTGSYFSLALFAVDAVLLIALIYGAHKKRVPFLKLYLVYGALSTLMLLLLGMCLAVQYHKVQTLLLLFVTVAQIYVLMLVRSEISKLKAENVEYIETCAMEERSCVSDVAQPVLV